METIQVNVVVNGVVVAMLVALPKTFSTGSRGAFGTGKIVIDGKQYQAQVQFVEIGSKPTK